MSQLPDDVDTFSYADPTDPRLKRFFIRLVERLTGQPYLKWLYEENKAHPVPGESFWKAAIRKLELKLVFNETGSSTLGINGVVFNSAGLGLSNLVPGTDFIDNGATNKVLASLNAASSTLRSEGSSLGSNLSIVQVRQDFSKSLINVLQTGSSNLTLADTNEEAANSQALSTRQSIAVSALSLANQSQQSVLQLLK